MECMYTNFIPNGVEAFLPPLYITIFTRLSTPEPSVRIEFQNTSLEFIVLASQTTLWAPALALLRTGAPSCQLRLTSSRKAITRSSTVLNSYMVLLLSLFWNALRAGTA